MQTIKEGSDYRLHKVLPKILGGVIGISFWVAPFTTLIWVFAGLMVLVLGLIVLVLCLSKSPANGKRYYPADPVFGTDKKQRKRDWATSYDWDDGPCAPIPMPGNLYPSDDYFYMSSLESDFIYSHEWD
jgi:hypothetical protein